MQLTRLVYASRHRDLSFEVIDQILQKSRANNERDRVTGAIVIGDDSFLQLLEGNRHAIGNCLMRIMRDIRHSDIQIVSCGDVHHRLFQEWNMHLIMASKVKRDILSMYHVNGAFCPNQMSEFAVEDLCRTLSKGNWNSESA